MITVGIPAFNRPEPLNELVESLLPVVEKYNVEILIVDDHSEPEIKLKSLDVCKGKIRLLRNSDKNLGYALTYLRLFKEAKTKYMMMMADDDVIDAQALLPLIEFVNLNNPDFLSSIYELDGKLYRGRKKLRKIKGYEFFEASSHAPGLIYNVDTVNKYIHDLEESRRKQHKDALLYPQVVLLASLLSRGADCMWYPSTVASQGYELESGHTDSSGQHYWSLKRRWDQVLAFDLRFESWLEDDFRDQLCLSDMKKENARLCSIHLLNGIKSESSYLFNYSICGFFSYSLKALIKSIVGKR